MKVVDIADETYRELGSPTDMSIPAIAFWLRTNLGSLNNHINTSFVVNETTYELEQETTDDGGTSVTLEIAEEEKSIFKKLYMLHYYDIKIRSNIISISTDSVVSVTDDNSSVTKINKNEVSRVLTNIKRLEFEELKNLINQYNLNKSAPIQVAGDDTVEGFYAVSRKFNRVPNNLT